jgi:2-polyprenyl-6-methoxyphenol hydroxylase-like FAD-dependent oxidoreductase
MAGLIIGAGIAGPTLGMFLRRIGVETQICEARASDAPDEGAFLGIAPNGMNVLAQLGLSETIERLGEVCHGFSFRNAADVTIGEIDASDVRTRFGAPLVMIKRDVLQRALAEAASKAGISIASGQKLTEIAQSATEVRATFRDGGVRSADFLVGCDGVHSRTRRAILPEAPEPAYFGLVGCAGMVEARDEPLAPGCNVMVFGKRAFFGAFRTSRGEIWWFHNGARTQPTEQLARYGRAELLAAHRDDPAWIGSLIERTPQVLGTWPQCDILSLPSWHRGRVCLIGDAAHASTPSAGQGSALALEDALVLARCLRDARAGSRSSRKQRASTSATRRARSVSSSRCDGSVWRRSSGRRANVEATRLRAACRPGCATACYRCSSNSARASSARCTAIAPSSKRTKCCAHQTL